MHKHIKLTNERLSVVDLSPLLDVDGQRLVLQPKGTPKSTKECEAAVLKHPHVIGYLNAVPPWISWSPVTVEETNAAPPQEPPAPPADEPPAAPVTDPPAPPTDETPAATDETESDDEPDPITSVETTNVDETVATGESLSLEVTTPSMTSETRGGKRNRNR